MATEVLGRAEPGNVSTLESIIAHHELAQMPAETIEWAKKRADKIRKLTKNNKSEMARMLYKKGHGYKWADWYYGFNEALKTGNYAPFPHEIKERSQCFSFAVAQYCVAKELGLKPKINNAIGMRDPDNSSLIDDSFQGDHFFVEIDTGNKFPFIIDKQMGLFGPVTYKNHSIKVRNQGITDITEVDYDVLIEFTEQELLDKISYLRTPKGSIEMLKVGEKVKVGDDNPSVIIKYIAEKNQLEIFSYAQNVFNKKNIIPNRLARIHRVQLDSNAEIISSTIELGYFKERDWDSFKDMVILDSIPTKDVLEYQKILLRQDREKKAHMNKREKAKAKNREYLRIGELLKKTYKNEGSIDQNLAWLAERMVMMQKWWQSKVHETEGLDRRQLIIDVNESYRALLEQRIRQGKDHDGYLYSEERRNSFFFNALEKGNEYFRNKYFETIYTKNALRKYGFIHDPNLNSKQRIVDRKMDNLGEMVTALGTLHQHCPTRYNAGTDFQCFYEENFKGIKSEEELAKKVSELKKSDELLTYATLMDNQLCLLASYSNLDGLLIKKYLPKVQEKIRDYLKETKTSVSTPE